MKEPPLVIATHEFYPKRGGIAVYVEETARAAAGLGWPVQVWAPVHTRLHERPFPFELYPLPVRGTLGWPDRRRCMKLLLRERHQLSESVLMLPEPGPILAAMYLEAMGGLKVRDLCLVLHGSEIIRCARLPHRRSLFGNLLKRATTVGVVSRYTRRLLLRHYPFAEDKVRLVPGGLRHDFTPVEPEPRDAAHCVVLSVGRLHPRKGQHCLLEAAANLPADLKGKVQIRLAGPTGSDAYLAQLRELAEQSGVAVEFDGEIDDIDLAKLYAGADIFALTSQRRGPSVEGFGLVAIEAGAAGLPVLAHRSGGIPEAVLHGQTGLLAGPGNRASLTDALARLINDADLRQRLGEAGKVRARQLSWKKNVETLLGVRQ